MIFLPKAISRYLPTFTLLAAAPFTNAFATELTISWFDNSDNEVGFIIDRKLESDSIYQTLVQLPDNTSAFKDTEVVEGETYCYRVSAYNQAGQAISDEMCAEASSSEAPIDPTLPPVEGGGIAAVSYELISKPEAIELSGKEFYSFKSGYTYNSEYSSEAIDNVAFDINSGSLKRYDKDFFIFKDHGSELENGYAHMPFHIDNSLEFTLTGNGASQTATLYMMAGVWDSEVTSFSVTAGSETTKIEIPKGYRWYYVAVQFEYKETVTVKVNPDTSVGGYSSVMFAGIVLNNESSGATAPDYSYASLQSVDLLTNKVISIEGSKYVTASGHVLNESDSLAQVNSINYEGEGKLRNSYFSIQSGDEISALEHWSMDWNVENETSIQLSSELNQVNFASVYIFAGAYSDNSGSFTVSINGVDELIELPKNNRWYYIKLDVEFEGNAEILIKPVGNIEGYSQVAFAGIALQ